MQLSHLDLPKLQFTHDPEAGTIYAYFTELTEGQAVDTLEFPASVALDKNGAIIGFTVRLNDDIVLSQLELVLDLAHCWLDGERVRLWLRIADEDPATQVRLEATAIFDLDEDEMVLGVEFALPEDLRTPERLARLAPLMLELEAADPAAPEGSDGPVVFAPVAEDADADEDADAEDAEDAESEADAFEGDDAELSEDVVAEEAAETAEDAAAEEPPILPPQPGDLARVGFVALVGKPNVGKSTLLNAILGQKVAIVSPRAQTTRVPLRGVLHRPDAQVVFIDTPGIHDPQHHLGQFMVDLARKTLPNADVVCFMVDISHPPSRLDQQIAKQLQRLSRPKLLVLNKVDQKLAPGVSYLEDYRSLGKWDMEIAISARRRKGVDGLLEEIISRLPLGPRLYPVDQVTDQNERQLSAELVREKILYFIQEEVPHAVAVEIEEWIEKDSGPYIRATINVEKESQKGILIGAHGSMIKRIGTAARNDIEKIIGRSIYLELHVKVRPNWRDDPAALGWLGYQAKNYQ